MTQNQRILAILADGQEHVHGEFYGFCVLHSRISELRKQGHQITVRRDGDDYLYRLDSLGKEGSPSRGEKTAREGVARCTLSDGPSFPSEPPTGRAPAGEASAAVTAVSRRLEASPTSSPVRSGGVACPAGGQLELFKAAA